MPAGLYKVQMEWACATLKLLVKPASHQPQLPSSEEPLPAAAASSRVPVTVTLSIEALQLSLWDDGRRRLVGPAPAQPSRGWRGQRQPDQHKHQPSPSVEMFCLHLSQLGLHMFRAWRPGWQLHWALVHSALHDKTSLVRPGLLRQHNLSVWLPGAPARLQSCAQ